MRQKIIAGNWKMNNDYEQGLSLFSEIINLVESEVHNKAKIVIACPYIHLHSLQKLNANAKLNIGAQNCHQEDAGAYTGEISAGMLKSAGAQYVILGHSERRQYFKEDNALLAKKVIKVLQHRLIPIFCIGETLEERNDKRHFDIIRTQLKEGLFLLSADQIRSVIIAYEPVWAIGTGLTASPEQAQEIHAFIRQELAKQYGSETAQSISILYGGSCNPKNASELFACADIDGGLIGGASLKARDFIEIIKSYN